MWRYLARRLIQVPLVLVVVSLMTFLITRATPGDPVQIMLGMQTSKEAAAAMRAEFNLDRSLPEQYGLWIGKVVTGDLGRSIRLNDPRDQPCWPSASRSACSSPPRPWPSRCWSRSRSASSRRSGATAGSTISVPATRSLGFAMPNFGLALILIYVFSIQLDWLPITGIGSVEQPRRRLVDLHQALHHAGRSRSARCRRPC